MAMAIPRFCHRLWGAVAFGATYTANSWEWKAGSTEVATSALSCHGRPPRLWFPTI
jgi:hypothetical protein